MESIIKIIEKMEIDNLALLNDQFDSVTNPELEQLICYILSRNNLMTLLYQFNENLSKHKQIIHNEFHFHTVRSRVFMEGFYLALACNYNISTNIITTATPEQIASLRC